jgi:hypothetical protein
MTEAKLSGYLRLSRSDQRDAEMYSANKVRSEANQLLSMIICEKTSLEPKSSHNN